MLYIYIYAFQAVVLCASAVYCIKDSVAIPSGKITANLTTDSRQAKIVNQDSEVNPDGSFYNVWDSDNNIRVQEEGSIKIHNNDEILSVSGKIAYNDDKGNPIYLTYIADENGFQPQGDHLPTLPPLPKSVARALEYIAKHPYTEKDNTKLRK